MALTDNILAYWNLNDDGSGGVSLVDSTGNGYTLTNNNGVTLGTGIIDGGGVFDGAGAYLDSTSNAFNFGTNDFSISSWVKRESSDVFNPIITNYDSFTGDAYYYGFFNDNLFRLYSANTADNIFTPLSIPAIGSWYYLTLTRSGSTFSLYLNGTLQEAVSSSANLGETSIFKIGGSDGPTWNGFIDEVGIWNRALTSTEVTELYNSGYGLTYPFAQLYFSGGNLSTLGNWWEDSAFTIPAASLPTSADTVTISSAVTSGTATYNVANITANIGSAVSITATINLTNAVNSGILIGETTLNGTASNVGTITGNATLNGTASNAGTITGAVVLNDTSFNSGNITGNVTFNENSYQGTSGAITGNVIVYYPAQNPLGGSVSGTITYFWPGGTGLWGGDVWIDGSLSFIIPEPSDVKAGVEYGPAEDPYVGTFSGGGGGIDLARLIGLPPFIQL